MDSGHDWHPVGLSHAVEAGSAAGTRLHGKELVVWRDAGGGAHVWEDRCPHRGMRLSFGFVRGDHIACLYHGWQYNGGGVCRHIPAHPDLAVLETIRVPVYPAAERGGMIWTTLSATPAPLPDDEPDTVPLRSLYLSCGSEQAIAALAAAPMTPFGSEAQFDARVDRVTDTLYAVSCGNDLLLVGLQTVSDARTALHLAICGAPDGHQGARRLHVNAWALRVRHSVEQPHRPAAAARGAMHQAAV